MVKAGYLQNDRVVIPDDVKKMSLEQLETEIEILEKEAKERKISVSEQENGKKYASA